MLKYHANQIPKANKKKINPAAKERCCYCEKNVQLRKVCCSSCKQFSHAKCAPISMEDYVLLSAK